MRKGLGNRPFSLDNVCTVCILHFRPPRKGTTLTSDDIQTIKMMVRTLNLGECNENDELHSAIAIANDPCYSNEGINLLWLAACAIYKAQALEAERLVENA